MDSKGAGVHFADPCGPFSHLQVLLAKALEQRTAAMGTDPKVGAAWHCWGCRLRWARGSWVQQGRLPLGLLRLDCSAQACWCMPKLTHGVAAVCTAACCNCSPPVCLPLIITPAPPRPPPAPQVDTFALAAGSIMVGGLNPWLEPYEVLRRFYKAHELPQLLLRTKTATLPAYKAAGERLQPWSIPDNRLQLDDWVDAHANLLGYMFSIL